MAYFNIKKQIPGTIPIPEQPGYIPPTPPVPPTAEAGSVPVIPRPTYAGDLHIIFYKIFDDSNHLIKTLYDPLSMEITVQDSVDVLSPYIVLNHESVHTYNYCYIQELARYYYCKCVALPSGLTGIQMDVDALFTYKDGIKACNGIVVKSEDQRAYNKNINDGTFVNQQGEAIEVLVYDAGFNDNPTNILITAG